MAVEAVVGVEQHAAENERTARDDAVNIITMADSVGPRNPVL
jgi:hypothetical protein